MLVCANKDNTMQYDIHIDLSTTCWRTLNGAIKQCEPRVNDSDGGHGGSDDRAENKGRVASFQYRRVTRRRVVHRTDKKTIRSVERVATEADERYRGNDQRVEPRRTCKMMRWTTTHL